MSNRLDRHPSLIPSGTSIGRNIPRRDAYRVVSVNVFPASFETSNSESNSDWSLFSALEKTTLGLVIPSQISASLEANRAALNELRKLSGLTWEQLARLFNASRRSLHFWASGQPLSRFNEETLNRLLGTIQYINRGSASLNRSVLFSPLSGGNLPFDLLTVGKYEEVKQLLGPGNAPQKPNLTPLSADASASRTPQNPGDLVNALQDSVPYETGRSRPGRSSRSRKRGRTQ